MSPSKKRVFKFLHELCGASVEAVEALSEGQALMVGNDLEDACRALAAALKGKSDEQCDPIRNWVARYPEPAKMYVGCFVAVIGQEKPILIDYDVSLDALMQRINNRYDACELFVGKLSDSIEVNK